MIDVGKSVVGGAGCRCCDTTDGVLSASFSQTGSNHSVSVQLCPSCREALIAALEGARPAGVQDAVDRAEERVRYLRWRHIEPGDGCLSCHGAGVRMYGSTSTWRGGMGGAAMSTDVCDGCWGTGDRYHHGCNLRQLRDEESARVAAAAVDALARSAGATLRTSAGDVKRIVSLLNAEADAVDKPRRRQAGSSIWYSPLLRGLASLLERAVRAR